MKSTCALTLIASLVGSVVPVAAHDRIASTDGPIASAVTRAAIRLAGDPQAEIADPNWSRVRKIAPGTELIVTARGTPPATRYFVAADGVGLWVLNLSDSALPGNAMRRLRDIASTHPEYFMAQTGGFVDADMRAVPDGGVFMANRKVADLGQIVGRIARADVTEVATPVRMRGSTGVTVAGMAAGFAFGIFLLMSTVDCPFAGNCGAWQVRRAAPVWLPVAGGLVGYHSSAHEVGGVIYRAP